MRVSIPITIKRASEPNAPHLVLVHLDGQNPMDVLGMSKDDDSIVLFKIDNDAILVNDDDTVTVIPHKGQTVYQFAGVDSQAPIIYAEDYEWVDIDVSKRIENIGNNEKTNFIISLSDEENFTFETYDYIIDDNVRSLDIPFSEWISV